MRYVFLIIFIFMLFKDKFHRKITFFAGISSIITLLFGFIIKRIYFKPRPFVNHQAHVLSPVPSKKSTSFPSKHTTLAFVAATSVLIHKRVLGCILYLFACLTGFSRIWMGQHYPSDIIGSAILGSLASIAIHTCGWPTKLSNQYTHKD